MFRRKLTVNSVVMDGSNKRTVTFVENGTTQANSTATTSMVNPTTNMVNNNHINVVSSSSSLNTNMTATTAVWSDSPNFITRKHSSVDESTAINKEVFLFCLL